MAIFWKKNHHTVDGSEIRPSPVEVGSFSHYLQGFSTIPGKTRWISSNHQPEAA